MAFKSRPVDVDLECVVCSGKKMSKRVLFCFFFVFSVFFFFQAEDGIRDIGVTGVQTCALPI